MFVIGYYEMKRGCLLGGGHLVCIMRYLNTLYRVFHGNWPKRNCYYSLIESLRKKINCFEAYKLQFCDRHCSKLCITLKHLKKYIFFYVEILYMWKFIFSDFFSIFSSCYFGYQNNCALSKTTNELLIKKYYWIYCSADIKNHNSFNIWYTIF